MFRPFAALTFLLVALVAAAALVLMPSHHAAMLTGAVITEAPPGYAPPWDVFTGQPFFTLARDGNDLHVAVDRPDAWIYRRFYTSTGGSWEAHDFSGALWQRDAADATIPGSSEETYALVYTCKRNAQAPGGWDCGCAGPADSSCRRFAIQHLDAQPVLTDCAAVFDGPTNGHCADITPRSFTASWTPSSTHSENPDSDKQLLRVGPVRQEVLLGCGAASSCVLRETIPFSTDSRVINQLVPGVNYYVRVVNLCRDADGTPRWTDKIWNCTTASTRTPLAQVRSVEYPGPTYTPACYHRGFKPGCFNAADFRTDMETIKAGGFNTVWMPAFRRDFQPSANPDTYSDDAFNNLNEALAILEDLNMTLITSPQYGIGGLWPVGANEQHWLVDDDEWTGYEAYVAEFARQTKPHNNLYFVVFTEGAEPKRQFAQTDPLLLQSFRSWAKSTKDDVAFWNHRWNTNFATMDDILPNPPENNGRNPRFLDYQRWAGSLIRQRFSNLPALIKEAHPGALVGYHDYSLITLDWAKDLWGQGSERFLPVDPDNNPYDFMSTNFYHHLLPDLAPEDVPAEAAARVERFRQYYGNIPLLFGETGANTHDYTDEERVAFLTPLYNYLATEQLGFNFWNWRDPGENPPPGKERSWSHGLLDKDGDEKPSYQELFPH